MRNTVVVISLIALLVRCSSESETAIAANFPNSVTIAPIDEALTFARVQADSGLQLLAVNKVDGDHVTAINLTKELGPQYTDPIAAFNGFGYDALQARIAAGFAQTPMTVPLDTLVLPVDLTNAHIAAGTNFAEHAEESEVEDGPFLFAKLVEPTPFRAPVPAGDALLDYEVEVAFVTLNDAPLPGLPKYMGLIAVNDFTNRAALLRHVNPDDVTSGDGFTTGKSAPGYLPVGNLFVIPRNLDSFANALDLKLAVNGALRQHADMTLAIWDIAELLRQTDARQEARWDYNGATAQLPVTNGAIPARTLILAGTPAGTVFDGISKRTMVSGLAHWIAGGWNKPVAKHVIDQYISAEEKNGRYLKPGDTVSIRIDGLGTIENTIVQ